MIFPRTRLLHHNRYLHSNQASRNSRTNKGAFCVPCFLTTDLDKPRTRFILVKYRTALYPISPYQVLSAGQQPLAEYERSLWPSAGLFLWREECQLSQSSLSLLRQVLNIPFIISYDIRGMTITQNIIDTAPCNHLINIFTERNWILPGTDQKEIFPRNKV